MIFRVIILHDEKRAEVRLVDLIPQVLRDANDQTSSHVNELLQPMCVVSEKGVSALSPDPSSRSQ